MHKEYPKSELDMDTVNLLMVLRDHEKHGAKIATKNFDKNTGGVYQTFAAKIFLKRMTVFLPSFEITEQALEALEILTENTTEMFLLVKDLVEVAVLTGTQTITLGASSYCWKEFPDLIANREFFSAELKKFKLGDSKWKFDTQKYWDNLTGARVRCHA